MFKSHDKIIQSTKMAYVGFQDLLGSTLYNLIPQKRFDSHLNDIGSDRDKWEEV
jgi:hypothetical protein